MTPSSLRSTSRWRVASTTTWPFPAKDGRDFVKHLYQENLLVKNQMMGGCGVVDLQRIRCPNSTHFQAHAGYARPAGLRKASRSRRWSAPTTRRRSSWLLLIFGLAMGSAAQRRALAPGGQWRPSHRSGSGQVHFPVRSSVVVVCSARAPTVGQSSEDGCPKRVRAISRLRFGLANRSFVCLRPAPRPSPPPCRHLCTATRCQPSPAVASRRTGA